MSHYRDQRHRIKQRDLHGAAQPTRRPHLHVDIVSAEHVGEERVRRTGRAPACAKDELVVKAVLSKYVNIRMGKKATYSASVARRLAARTNQIVRRVVNQSRNQSRERKTAPRGQSRKEKMAGKMCRLDSRI
jgi:hypothetical protein